ncbi:unnamed protein product [Urochloa humidicola]
MRIRKRTPARAADPGPAPSLSASPPPPSLPLQPQHPKERSREDGEEEEKRVILIAGVRVQGAEPEGDRVIAAAASNDSAMDDGVPKPEPEPQPQGAAVRCSRNDGRQWRCKGTAVPGYLLCDRHVAWSSRKRKPPKPRKQKQQHGSGRGGAHTAKDEEAEEDTPQPVGLHDGGDDDDGGFLGGFQKRAKGGASGPAA